MINTIIKKEFTPISVVLTTICLFVLFNVNVFAMPDPVPDPVKGTCKSCEPPVEGVFSFGYDKAGNKTTIFVSSDPDNGGIVVNPGWGVFIVNNNGVLDFYIENNQQSPFNLNLHTNTPTFTVNVEVEEDVEIEIIDLYEVRTVVSSVLIVSGGYQSIAMPLGTKTNHYYGLIAKKNGVVVKTEIFYFN